VPEDGRRIKSMKKTQCPSDTCGIRTRNLRACTLNRATVHPCGSIVVVVIVVVVIVVVVVVVIVVVVIVVVVVVVIIVVVVIVVM
jgi:hypothetical protein